MKYVVLVLGVAVLFAGGCGQKSNKETTPETGGAEAMATVDSLRSAVQQKNDGQAYSAKGTDNSSLINASNEVWTANIGGNVVVHSVAIVFLSDNKFIYKNAYKEVEGKEWENVVGTIGRWSTDGNKITMIFSDGYTITVPYAVIDDELTFDFGDGYDSRLGSGVGIHGAYSKEKVHSP